MDCIFCKIVKGEIPGERMYETDKSVAILDLFPLNKGHVLVIPKKHYEKLLEIPLEEFQDMIQVAYKVAQGMVKALNPDGYHLLMNNGKASGQEIDHSHLHIIPRFSDDGIKFGWRHLKYEEEELKAYGEKLRQAIGSKEG